MLIKANIDNSYDVDGIFMDLETGEYVTMSDQEGAPGHSDNGFGTVIASDNWAPVDCRFFRYDFKEIIDGAVRENLTIVYNTDGTYFENNNARFHISRGLVLHKRIFSILRSFLYRMG